MLGTTLHAGQWGKTTALIGHTPNKCLPFRQKGTPEPLELIILSPHLRLLAQKQRISMGMKPTHQERTQEACQRMGSSTTNSEEGTWRVKSWNAPGLQPRRVHAPKQINQASSGFLEEGQTL